MGISKLIPQVIDSTVTHGKHKIPRFIYHLTTPDKYEKILKDGFIRPSGDQFFGEGVFALELTNLFKRWRRNKTWAYENLMERLLKRVVNSKGEICVLKIPTRNLDTDKLVVRSQNRLFHPLYTRENISSDLMKKIVDFVEEKCSKGNCRRNDAVILALEKFQPNLAEHLEYGTPAKFAKLFKQRKEAIEYIYEDNIPASTVEKIGETNLTDLKYSKDYNIARPLKSIFTSLLKGTPEVKGAELLNC